MHGKTSPIHHEGKGIFQGLPQPMTATRYHSLIVGWDSLPDCLEVTAWTETPEGQRDEIMGLRHLHPARRGGAVSSRVDLLTGGQNPPRELPGREARIMSHSLTEDLDRLARGEALTREGARDLMLAIMGGEASEAQIAAVLMALRQRGETVAEISSAAEAMRSLATAVPTPFEDLIDTCGTGGRGTSCSTSPPLRPSSPPKVVRGWPSTATRA